MPRSNILSAHHVTSGARYSKRSVVSEWVGYSVLDYSLALAASPICPSVGSSACWPSYKRLRSIYLLHGLQTPDRLPSQLS